MGSDFLGSRRLRRRSIVPLPLVEAVAAVFLFFFNGSLLTNLSAEPPPIASHWFYCVETETQKQKDTYFSSTFESFADQKDLLHDFSAFIAKEYDVPAEHLMGSCYAVRRYKPDNFANVEEQRSQHMEQSHKQGQNVIATGWAPK